MERYKLTQPACLPEKGEWGAYAFNFSYLEMIIAQDEYLAQLSSAQRRALLQEALSKYTAKELLVYDVYGMFGLETDAFVMARVMQAEQYAPFAAAIATNPDLRLFVSDVEAQGKLQTLDTVVDYARKF